MNKIFYLWLLLFIPLVTNGQESGSDAIIAKKEKQPATIYDNKIAWDSAVIQNGFKPEGAFDFVERDPELYDVLIIGNSISIGYTPKVRKLLEAKANVYRIPQNGGHTGTMLEKAEEWLPATKKWDVIHFNFGLHDLKYLKNGELDITGEQVIPVDEYKRNLEKIVPILKKSLKEDGELIFATTSVIPLGARGRNKGDELKYNKAALEVMKEFPEIIIDDQYELTSSFPEEQRSKNVHFWPEGQERQARQVAASISRALKFPNQIISLNSPDRHLLAKIYLDTSSRQLTIEMYRDKHLILFPSTIGMIINETDLGQNAQILSAKGYTINEFYPWNGNHSVSRNHCNGNRLELSTNCNLDLRMYNDGLAFKFGSRARDSLLFCGESTVLNFSSSLTAKYMQEKMSEESKIFTGPITGIEKRTMPPLLLYTEDQSEYIMALEGGGFDFHGYSLLPSASETPGKKTASFKVDYAEKPHGWNIHHEINTAWKIICSVNSLNELVNTDIVRNVCPPPDPELFPHGANEPWIKPGKSTWNWWARVSVDFQEQLKMVDLASEIGADYHLVDIGWDMKWQDAKKSCYDYLHDLCAYAADRGIGIFVWKTSDISFNLIQNKENPQNKFLNMKGYDISKDTSLMREEVERIARAGAKGIKLDYIQSENSEWKLYMENFLKVCAKNKLMVDFHGCPIPAGESRTYPNEITREGIWGGEKLRGGGGAQKMPTSHYIDQVFTRFIAGHADFTPGILDSIKGKGYTRAMQLASAMIFTSPFLCWADHPENYLSSPGLSIIKTLPTTWDETLVLKGSKLSELAVFARRKGSDWWIAGINGSPDKIHTYTVPLNFLGPGTYNASILEDDIQKGGPEIHVNEKKLCRDNELVIDMLPNGGFIMQLKELRSEKIFLENELIRASFDKSGTKCTLSEISRKDGSDNIQLSSEEFEIYLLNNERLTVSDYILNKVESLQTDSSDMLQMKYNRKLTNADGPEIVTVIYTLEKDPYIHKQVILGSNSSLFVDRLQVCRFSTNEKVTGGGHGQPLFIDHWFMGMDYPGFYSWHSNNFKTPEFNLRAPYEIDLEAKDQELFPEPGLMTMFHFPGYAEKQADNTWQIKSKIAVLGISPDNKNTAEIALLEYIDQTRLQPKSFLNFNNWYSIDAKNTTTKDFINNTFLPIKDYFDLFGVKLNAMVMDSGWQDGKFSQKPYRIYLPKIDDKHEDPVQISKTLKSFGSALGIWLAIDGRSSDIKNGIEKSGYRSAFSKTFDRNKYPWTASREFFDILQKKYQEDLKESLRFLEKDVGVNYFKHDFNHMFTSHYITDRHAREKCLDATLEILKYERQLNPEIFLNFTNGTWFSPFWLQHVHTLWMMSGDSGGSNFNPQLSLRDGATTYRDTYFYENFRSSRADRPVIPIANFMTHGIIYTERKPFTNYNDIIDDWSNYVVMYYGRGTTVKELYISPDLLSEDQWKVLAMASKWAVDNQDVLMHTAFIGGDPALAEAYGYVSWNNDKSIITVRNPGRKQQSLQVSFNARTYFKGKKGERYRARCIYPYLEDMPWKLESGKDFTIEIPGDCVMVFEIEKGKAKSRGEIQVKKIKNIKTRMTQSGYSINLTIPDEEFRRLDFLLESWMSDSLHVSINGKSLPSDRSNSGKGWNMSSWDLRPYKGKMITLECMVHSGKKLKPQELSKMKGFLLMDRPVIETPAKKNIGNTPLPIMQGYRPCTECLFEFREPPGKIF